MSINSANTRYYPSAVGSRSRNNAAVHGNFEKLAGVFKFVVVFGALIAVLVYAGIKRNQSNQANSLKAAELHNTRKEVAELQKRRDNCIEELERLRGGSAILVKARRLGLRPTDSTQQITCGRGADGRIIQLQGRTRVAQF
jgi:cell division protein FtsB